MLEVGGIMVSDDLKDAEFICHLEKCKGACCVEGELGAPLEEEELTLLDTILDKIKPYLSRSGIEAIQEQGLYVLDEDGDFSTPTVKGRECAYATYEKNGTLKCGIEQAYLAGKTTFRKPISCHLYPLRIKKTKHLEAINYHRWSICLAACAYGKLLKVPLYIFLKVPLIRKYGKAWYKELVRKIVGVGK